MNKTRIVKFMDRKVQFILFSFDGFESLTIGVALAVSVLGCLVLLKHEVLVLCEVHSELELLQLVCIVRVRE